MKLHQLYFSIVLVLFCLHAGHAQSKEPEVGFWTFTYLKANESQKENLRTFIEKNWFAMDSIAVFQGLLKRYELMENKSEGLTEWDFIVAVEYFTEGGYTDIAEKFEGIRQNHVTVKVSGLGLKELGKIVRSETLTKKEYSNN